MNILSPPFFINFNKYFDGLLPTIIQDIITNKILMMGYMNKESYEQTITKGKVIFYSRSRKKLWTKGEQSKNYLLVKKILIDCDLDTLLIKAEPLGPICHTGKDTCWGENNVNNYNFLEKIEQIIQQRKIQNKKNSYISDLMRKGINKISQKVGEESIELIIEAKDNDTEKFLNEAADLLLHYLILLQSKGHYLKEVIRILEKRHN